MNSDWKCVVDDVEGADQPLAAFLVEADDRLPQAADRFAQIVFFRDESAACLFRLGQFLVGAQIDGPEPVALALQMFELALDVGEGRQRRVARDAGAGREVGRRAIEIGRDVMHMRVEPFFRGFEARLAARLRLARRRHGIERRAGRRVGVARLRFGRGLGVRRGAFRRPRPRRSA